MPAADAARGKLARLAMSVVETATIDKLITFAGRASPGCSTEMINIAQDMGGFGDLAHAVENTRENIKRVVPSFAFKPSTGELGQLLEWLLYGTPTGSGTVTYPLGATPKVRKVAFDDVKKYWEMTDVICSRFTLSAQAAGELSLQVDGVGTDYTNAGTFPAGLSVLAGPRLLFRDLAATIGATANVKIASVQLQVDHAVSADRYYFGATNAGGVNLDRRVTLQMTLPYGLHHALWDAGAGDAGVAVTLPFTYGSYVLTLTMPAVRTPKPPVEVNVGDETMLAWAGQAFKTGSTAELSVTLATP